MTSDTQMRLPFDTRPAPESDTEDTTSDAATSESDETVWIYQAPEGEPWCVPNRTLYLSVLAEPPEADESPERHSQYEKAVRAGRIICADRCALFEECLQRALVGPPIDGFVAGTTSVERRRLRKALNIKQATDADANRAAGAPARAGAEFSTDTVVQAVHAHPNETQTEIARRLNCSAATVKRHLRKHRTKDPAAPSSSDPPAAAMVQATRDMIKEHEDQQQAEHYEKHDAA